MNYDGEVISWLELLKQMSCYQFHRAQFQSLYILSSYLPHHYQEIYIGYTYFAQTPLDVFYTDVFSSTVNKIEEVNQKYSVFS